MSVLPLMDAQALRELAAQRREVAGRCPGCGGLACLGWETLPGGFDASRLQTVGTLRDPHVHEPTVEEHHLGGTHTWSPEAPIAPNFHPYNRSDVLQCRDCGRAFVRYTEYGGYYREDRIRELRAELVVQP